MILEQAKKLWKEYHRVLYIDNEITRLRQGQEKYEDNFKISQEKKR